MKFLKLNAMEHPNGVRNVETFLCHELDTISSLKLNLLRRGECVLVSAASVLESFVNVRNPNIISNVNTLSNFLFVFSNRQM
ncbi:hypothetical protein L596_021489 [Steinernema carpocapsae]|uniref:Uncharacterized protein n=1 Tax=Steinernema carpocapsae TaxID=34508 RepID=A0A4U5MJQ5_STECR|nr:hypothetical protein L596_021489 [Steinernema carpocapsae]